MTDPTLWVATIPLQVLARPVRVVPVLLDGFIDVRCPLCDRWLGAFEALCPGCKLALDWTGYRNQRRAAWNAVKDYLLNAIAYEEPPSPDEAVEAGESLLAEAYGKVDGAAALLESYGDKPLHWLLKRWAWLRRNQ
jgi:hypothetical protein